MPPSPYRHAQRLGVLLAVVIALMALLALRMATPDEPLGELVIVEIDDGL